MVNFSTFSEVPQVSSTTIRMATETPSSQTIECGEEATKQFAFDAGYINLNHG
jgi:hypothetical protein